MTTCIQFVTTKKLMEKPTFQPISKIIFAGHERHIFSLRYLRIISFFVKPLSELLFVPHSTHQHQHGCQLGTEQV